MQLTVIGSGSSGNCYLLKHNNETLVIEMGMPFKEVKKALNYKVTDIVGAICSHTHNDHYKYHKDFEVSGIKCFYPFNTTDRSVHYGSFHVQAFEVPHDPDIHCFGFYIKVGSEKLLFVTDCMYCPFSFQKLKVNHIMAEANYIEGFMPSDGEGVENYVHKVAGHMSLKTCMDFIKANSTNSLRNVFLLHLGAFSDSDVMLEEVKKIVDADVDVNICKGGKTFELDSIF